MSSDDKKAINELYEIEQSDYYSNLLEECGLSRKQGKDIIKSFKSQIKKNHIKDYEVKSKLTDKIKKYGKVNQKNKDDKALEKLYSIAHTTYLSNMLKKNMLIKSDWEKIVIDLKEQIKNEHVKDFEVEDLVIESIKKFAEENNNSNTFEYTKKFAKSTSDQLAIEELYKILHSEECIDLINQNRLTYGDKNEMVDYFIRLIKQNHINKSDINDLVKSYINSHYRRKFKPGPLSTNQNYELTQRKRNITPSMRIKVFERDNYTCQICQRSSKHDHVKLEVDHIIPVSRGGSDNISNLQTLCFDCNRGKSNKILDNH